MRAAGEPAAGGRACMASPRARRPAVAQVLHSARLNREPRQPRRQIDFSQIPPTHPNRAPDRRLARSRRFTTSARPRRTAGPRRPGSWARGASAAGAPRQRRRPAPRRRRRASARLRERRGLPARAGGACRRGGGEAARCRRRALCVGRSGPARCARAAAAPRERGSFDWPLARSSSRRLRGAATASGWGPLGPALPPFGMSARARGGPAALEKGPRARPAARAPSLFVPLYRSLLHGSRSEKVIAQASRTQSAARRE